ncbi:hypothetical protein POM88_023781 [Heracleum sosnowskyi]|uniref:WAT1-related protein n=1 Tax=Heracleum sosnowskyi TaxID=360622 RepID=A0AAD8II98_9APIA|nr:hypothetical protein POM88_023781 [Heracleum sosnowskyi]
MVIVQTAFAGVNVLYKLASNDGMNLRILVAYRFIFAAAFIVPLALFVERNKRPKLTWMVILQGFFCGLLGIQISLQCIRSSCIQVSQPCRESLGRRRITSVTVEEAMPAKHKVIPVDINSEAKARDADQEIGVLDAKRFDGDAEDHQL